MFSRLAAQFLKPILSFLSACIVGGVSGTASAEVEYYLAGTWEFTTQETSDGRTIGNDTPGYMSEDANWQIWKLGENPAQDSGLAITGDLCVGGNGSWQGTSEKPLYGRVKIQSGTHSASGILDIGHGDYTAGYLKIEGGSLAIDGAAYLARCGWDSGVNSYASLEVSGGSLSINGSSSDADGTYPGSWGLEVGIGKSTSADILVENGTLSIPGGNLFVYPNGTWDNTSDGVTIQINDGGTLTVGTESSPASIYMGRWGSESIAVNIYFGGTLNVGSFARGGANGSADVNLNGGTISVLNNSTEGIDFIPSGVKLVVNSAGGTIDTKGKDITIASAVTGTGKLTLTGGGIVRFSDSYACSIVLEGTTTAYDSSNNEIKTAFTWKGATGANWSDGSNWWGGSAPGASDKAVFDGNASVTINANATVGGIVINNDAEVSLTTTKSYTLYVSGNIEDSTATKNSGKLILAGVKIAAQAAMAINTKLSFSENTTSTIQTDGNYGGFNVEIYGDVDGAGTVNWFTGGNSNNNRREHGIFLNCSFANFTGTAYVNINNYLHYLQMKDAACLDCAKSIWHIYENGTLPRMESGKGCYTLYAVGHNRTYRFGALFGDLSAKTHSMEASGDHRNLVFQIGASNVDCGVYGTLTETSSDNYNNWTIDWLANEGVVFTNKLSNLSHIIVSGGGTVEFAGSDYVPTYDICFTNKSGFVRFADGVTGSDILAKFKSSTAAIGFDDMNVSYNWNGEIDNSNSGGFTKKGGGTLTLSTAPKYTGTTTVLAGTLAITESKTFADAVAVSGGTFTPAAGSVFNGAVTVSSGTFDASAGVTFGGDVAMTGGAIKIACGASIPSLALTEAGALNVDLASAAVADGTALFTVASVADGETVNYLNQPEGFDSSKIQVVEQGGKTVYVYGVRTLTWNGASTTDSTAWSDSANWGNAGVPSAVDNISLPANPGFVLTEDVAVNDLTAASGLTLNLAYDLTVNGDLNVTGALVKNGSGKLIVKGTIANTLTAVTINGGTIEGSLPSSVAITLDSAALSSDTYTSTFGAKFVLGSAGTITDLSGDGTIVADATQTYSSSLDKTFVGTIGGTGGFTKAGSGTLTLVGSNSYSGNLMVSAGTLKLGAITDISGVRYNLDASAPSAFTKDESGNITAWNSTIGNFKFDYNKGSYIVTNETTVLGGNRAAYFGSDYTTMYYSWYSTSSGNNGNERSLSVFFAYQADSDMSTSGYLWGQASEGRAIKSRYSNKTWYASSPETTTGFYVNGVYGNGYGQYGQTQLLSACNTANFLQNNANAYDQLGATTEKNTKGNQQYGFKGLMGQVTAFTRVLSCEERKAAEAYLMDRWGIGSAGYHVIPESAAVSIANAATLDLNGLSQKVASLTAASGSTLKMTSDATLTVTGAAIVDGMTLKLTDTPSSGETYVLLTAASITGDVALDFTGDWALQVVDNGNNTKSLVLSDTVIKKAAGLIFLAF